MYND
jgi:hypothetical protein